MKTPVLVTIIVIILVVLAGAYFIFFKNPAQANTAGNLPGTTINSGNNVHIKNMAFSPATLTIKVGDTITWTNQDSASHTVTSDSGTELNSATLVNTQTYSHTFNTAGTFPYHCSIHPGMKATIIVQ